MGEGEPKCLVSQCCCGCTLKTGSLIIGILYIIGYLAQSAQLLQLSLHESAFWFFFVISFIQFIASCLLVHGVRTDRADLVRVWVFTTIGLCVLKIIAGIVGTVTTGDITGIIQALISCILDVYFIIVARSFAYELESGGAAPSAA